MYWMKKFKNIDELYKITKISNDCFYTKLNKKVEVIPGEIKEYKGNTFVGFLVFLFFLLIICGILYYLEINNYINITELI